VTATSRLSSAREMVSGGGRAGEEAMLDKARQSMDAGATGLIFGRNVWQHEHHESLRFITQLRDISCANAKPAFSRITATIARHSGGAPLTHASAAASISSNASGWVNCRASSPGHRRPPRRASSFGP
jgi:hypothetical protein